MKKVMVFGTFDLLHPGHIDFLKQAKKHGDLLYACVARDENVARIKGTKPVHTLSERMHSVRSTGIPDKVFSGDKSNFFTIISEKNPDTICLGYDQNSFGLEEYIQKNHLNIEVVRLKPFLEKIHKSSLIRKSGGNLL